MAIIRCSMGHFYDDTRDAECPMCRDKGKNNTLSSGINDQATIASYRRSFEERETIFLDMSQKNEGDPERTVGIFSKLKGNDFVTGWLVCVDGPERGRDYRLFHGYNRLGRRTDMDIFVGEDPAISREGHCCVVFDGKHNQFLLTAMNGNLVYKDGKLLQTPIRLESGDRFTVGCSEFEFIAFCREGHTWEKQ